MISNLSRAGKQPLAGACLFVLMELGALHADAAQTPVTSGPAKPPMPKVDHHFWLFDPPKLKLVHTVRLSNTRLIDGCPHGPDKLSFSRDGRLLLAKYPDPDSDGYGWGLCVWQLPSERLIFDQHFDQRYGDATGVELSAFALTPDSRYLITAETYRRGIDDDGVKSVFKVWELLTGRLAKQWTVSGCSIFEHGIHELALSPQGRHLAIVESQGMNLYVRLWAFPSCKERGRLCIHTPEADGGKLAQWFNLAFLPTGKQLLVETFCRSFLWDVDHPKQVFQVKKKNRQWLALSPNGKQFAAWVIPEHFPKKDAEKLPLYETFTGKLLAELYQVNVNSVSFHPDGCHLLCAGGSSPEELALVCWNLRTRFRVATWFGLPGWEKAGYLVLSPSGDLLAVAYDNRVEVWRIPWDKVKGGK
jgi:WD40 repeat protein